MASLRRRDTSIASEAVGDDPHLLQLSLHEVGQNSAEEPIFGQQLMHRLPAACAAASQLLRLCGDRRDRRHGLGLGRMDIAGDFQNQRGNVIEQFLCGEHLVDVNRQQLAEALQPSCRDRKMLRPNPSGNQVAKVGSR